MRLLPDTHVFVWWYTGDERLGLRAHRAIADSANEVSVSAVVVWEIAIKRALGRMRFDGSVEQAVAEEGFLPLPITSAMQSWSEACRITTGTRLTASSSPKPGRRA